MFYFSSDWHLDHANNIAYSQRKWALDAHWASTCDKVQSLPRDAFKGIWRLPTSVVDQHNLTIIENTNRVVKENDTLYLLGDLLFARRDSYCERLKYLRSLINCKNIVLILGNHDKELEYFFPDVPHARMVRCEGQKIWMTHSAQIIWDCCHRGAWNLYGHSHSNAEATLDEIMPGRFSMDVGIDNAYKKLGQARPFSFVEIKELFKGRTGFNVKHGDLED